MGKMGRPSKYKREFIKEAEKYLQECVNQRKVPFLEEFASRIGVSGDSVKRWTEANEDFCGAIERIKDYQRMALIKLGLKSPAMLIFLLKANHGMIEAAKIRNEGKGSKPLSIIFTDVATWKKKAEENRERIEKLDIEMMPIPEVQPHESSGGIGGYDSMNYSTRLNDLLTG